MSSSFFFNAGREFKGKNEEYFGELNKFSGFFRGGGYFMDSLVAFNPYIVRPFCKVSGDDALSKEIINLFSQGLSFCPEFLDRCLKDTSACTYYDRGGFLLSFYVLKVNKEFIYLFWQGFMGIWRGRFGITLYHRDIGEGGDVLKGGYSLFYLVIVGGCGFYYDKAGVFTVWADCKGIGSDKLLFFACDSDFTTIFIAVNGCNCKASPVKTIRALYRGCRIHRR